MVMKSINVTSIDYSIQLLEEYLDKEQIAPLLSALRDLKAEPGSESRFKRMAEAFESLGIEQGAVLTYAPYIGILLSDDPFSQQNFNKLRDDNANQ